MTMSFRVVALMLVGTVSAAGVLDGVSRSHTSGSLERATGVELVGLAGQHRTVGAADFAKLPHVSASVSSHNVQGAYRGVLLGELLRLVERPAGDSLRGKALATAISVEAADGYRVAFALAEVDSAFTNKVIFLADAKNGAPLDTAEGPFRLIVPDEKKPARWVKKVIRIRLVPVD